MRKNKGFTLIEILIVVAIIGILASIILVGLSSFRSQGRDARRIADLHQVQNALELYFTKNGTYPTAIADSAAGWTTFSNTLTGAGIGVYVIPKDPTATQTYKYAYSAGGYVLAATLENTGNPALANDVDGTIYSAIDCTGGTPETVYCVQL